MRPATQAAQLIQCRLTIFQCEQRPGVFALFAAVQFIVTTTLTLYFVVFLRRGATGMLTARALGATGALVVACVVSPQSLRSRWQWKFVREALRIALPLVPHGLMATGLVAADRFILQRYRPMSEVGLYSLAYSFGMVMALFTNALWQAWSTLFLNLLRNGKHGRSMAAHICGRVVLILAAIASAGELMSQNIVRVCLDPHYWEAGRVAPIIIGAYLCHALFLLLQLFALQAKRTSWIWAVSSIALTINIALNFAFAPIWGMYGAAYATLIAYGSGLRLRKLQV